MLIVYNASALATSDDERILRADIRYFRRQSPPPSSPSSAVDNAAMTSAVLLELTSRRFRPLGAHLLMTSQSQGWVSVDVTSSLRRLRRRRRRPTRRRSFLLALTFSGGGQSAEDEGRRQLATRRRRTAAELRLLSSPTLVVFSRRTADIANDHVLPHIPKYRPPASTWRSSAHRRRHRQVNRTFILFYSVVDALPCNRSCSFCLPVIVLSENYLEKVWVGLVLVEVLFRKDQSTPR